MAVVFSLRRRWRTEDVIYVFFFSYLYIYANGNCSKRDHPKDVKPSSTFHSHDTFTPYMFKERSKREVQTKTADGHLEELTLNINVFNKEYIVDLQINRGLLPSSHFEKHHSSGKYTIRRPFTSKNATHCYYKGHLRGIPGSWAALSTCNGVSGAIYDGHELHYVEPSSSSSSSSGKESGTHYAYRHSDLKEQNFTCGYEGTGRLFSDLDSIIHKKRFRRNSEIYGPYNSNSKSRYVELILVNDNKLFKGMKGDVDAVYARSKEIANIANALYAPLNIFIALVGVVVWSEFDEITLSTDGDTTLTNFLYYRRERLVQVHPNDNAQLITGIAFNGGVVGKALKGPICTYEYSGGVNMDHNPLVGLVATTVAHELGHNFGMEHDDDDCDCPEDKCIMAPASSQTSPTHWSSCSLDYLKLAFDHGMDYCLRNKPDHIIGPVCGNGFVEQGEECDCGLKSFCNNPCCNASSCTLFVNASCATGECCDLRTCKVKPIATPCRAVESECDLPEYCNGESEFCPVDVYTQDGISCKGGRAFCFHGQCRTHSDQCKLLWGNTGQMSDRQCFDNNRKGNALGNCGYYRVNQSYKACSHEDLLCGMLHCTHLNERLEFGMESVAILSRSFITEGDRILPCRSAIVDLGLNSIDPGLAPDGSRCGEDRVCVNQKCLHVASLKVATCESGCSGNGICNNNGNCHCNSGYAPPYCDYPGAGGSEDSGPATDPNATSHFAYVLYVIFFAIIPMFALSFFVFYYHRGHIKTWWIAKAREKAINKRTKEAAQRRNRLPSKLFLDKLGFQNQDIAHPVSTAIGATESSSCPNKPLPSLPQSASSGSFPTATATTGPTLMRTQSIKAAKLNLDRNSLRNLEISHPIPQVHVTVPSAVVRSVPVRPAPPCPTSPLQGKGSGRGKHSASDVSRPPSWVAGSGSKGPGMATVTRTSSMQEPGGHVPVGSFRLRRLSSNLSFRPTNPPPRPPPNKDVKENDETSPIYEAVIYSDLAYDDCHRQLDKGRLCFADDEPAKNLEESKVNNGNPHTSTHASHLYAMPKPSGKIGLGVSSITNGGGTAKRGGATNDANKIFLPSAMKTNSTASSLVGALAKRFELQSNSSSGGGSDSNSASQQPSKVQGVDGSSFRLGSSFRNNIKPPLAPKPPQTHSVKPT